VDISRLNQQYARMRIRIAHETRYVYDVPPKGVIQTLRLTPRNHDGQYIVDWRIDVSADCRLNRQEDAFGNIMHSFTADGPLDALTITVEGEVETRDTSALVRDSIERFPPSLFLRATPLTQSDPAIDAFASDVAGHGTGDRLETLHDLLARLHGAMTFDPDPTHVLTTATEAFALKRGVCQDLSHIFIAAARSMGIPARYVSGYYRRPDVVHQTAGHAWAEAHVENLGWVGFDPTHGVCPSEAHVRVAIGLDYLGASPVRGTRFGGGTEALTVAIAVEQARAQSQT
jgi:transglutaminase-like putative cysteine protease